MLYVPLLCFMSSHLTGLEMSFGIEGVAVEGRGGVRVELLGRLEIRRSFEPALLPSPDDVREPAERDLQAVAERPEQEHRGDDLRVPAARQGEAADVAELRDPDSPRRQRKRRQQSN